MKKEDVLSYLKASNSADELHEINRVLIARSKYLRNIELSRSRSVYSVGDEVIIVVPDALMHKPSYAKWHNVKSTIVKLRKRRASLSTKHGIVRVAYSMLKKV